MAVIIDTSAVLAAADRADPAHERVVAALKRERSPILLPTVALPEVSFLIETRHGFTRAAATMSAIVRGSWPIIDLDAADLIRATELMSQYADSRIGFVDAAIAALAERLEVTRIHTLDRRDFAIIRPRHTDAFEVQPA